MSGSQRFEPGWKPIDLHGHVARDLQRFIVIQLLCPLRLFGSRVDTGKPKAPSNELAVPFSSRSFTPKRGGIFSPRILHYAAKSVSDRTAELLLDESAIPT